MYRGEIQPRPGGHGEYDTMVYDKKTGERISGPHVQPTVDELKLFLAGKLPGFYIVSDTPASGLMI